MEVVAVPGDADAALGVEQDQLPGQMVRVVADKAVFHRGNGPVHQLHPHGGAPLPVPVQRLGPLLGVPGGHVPGNGGGIGQTQVKKPRSRVGKQGGDVVADGIALGLPLLGHDVADIDLQGVGLPDRLHDAIHQQIGDDAGVQAAGPQDDHIRVGDGGDRLRQGLGPGGDQTHLADAAVLLLLQ